MDKTLTGVNPRSGKANYLLTIGKLMPASRWVPQHVKEALNILHRLAYSKEAQSQMVHLFTSPGIRNELMHGFVECLDEDELEIEVNKLLASFLCHGCLVFSNFSEGEETTPLSGFYFHFSIV